MKTRGPRGRDLGLGSKISIQFLTVSKGDLGQLVLSLCFSDLKNYLNFPVLGDLCAKIIMDKGRELCLLGHFLHSVLCGPTWTVILPAREQQ